MLNKLIAGLLSVLTFATPATNVVAPSISVGISTPAVEISDSAEVTKKDTISSDEELTAAILKFKNVFGDTDMYDKFNHYINEYNGVKTYQLQWSNSTSGESIYATVGVNGMIYSYDYYNYNETNNSRLPKIFKDKALDIAYEFVKKTSPDAIDNLSKDYAEVSLSRYQNKYSVTFYRIVNDYIVNNESVTVTIDQNEKITNYSRNNYSSNVKNPSVPKLAEEETITNVLNENIPFELAYRTIYTNGYSEKAEMKLVYVVNSEAGNYVVNAETGKLLKTDVQNIYSTAQARNEEAAAPETAASMSADYSLTEVESKAVEMQKSFITVDDITKLLLSVEEFAFNEKYKVSGSNLYSSESVYTKNLTYYWNVSYRTDDNKYASVTVNAETSEIKSYYLYDNIVQPLTTKTEPELKYENAVKYTDKFLEKYYPEKFKEYKFNSENSLKSDNYYVEYVRYVNDIATRERINVNLNPETLEITSLFIEYSDATFPSPDKAITPEKAMEQYIGLYGLEPKYITYTENKDDTLYLPSNRLSDTTKEIMLVYSINNYYNYIDAFTGKVIDSYEGKTVEYTPRKYYTSTAFTDIKNHKYEKEITMLSQMDIIATDKEKYNPEASITYIDFKNLLSSAAGGSFEYNGRTISITSGNLAAAKNETITRENAIMELIVVMGYSDVAKLQGIFNVDHFIDSDSISDSLAGYIAIAKGMGLLDTFGTKLSPKLKLTRAEAAYLIYSYIVYEDVYK